MQLEEYIEVEVLEEEGEEFVEEVILLVLMDCHALVSPLYVGKEKAHMVWE